MTQEYCIYRGTNLPANELNEDHVIPLALGGADDFVIRASRKFTSGIGDKLEGQLAVELEM